MPISDAHRSIIQTSLTAVRERGIDGVALGGGNGLIGQGISDRFTADVDLLCRDEDNVPAVAEGISEELASAGYRVTLRAAMVGLVELVVAAPAPADDPGAVNDADASELQIAYFDFSDADDVDGLGPVASKDDLVGFKAAAWGGRHLERDAVDLAAAITVASYTTRQLIGLAMERDPGLAAEDWSEAMDWFDTRMTDADLADYCSGGLTPAKVRESLADWPRTVDEWAAFLADVARETPI
jgi:hypothetical protein